MKYKINSYNPETRIAEVVLELRDGTTFTDKMQNLPVEDKEALEAYLLEFANAVSDDREKANATAVDKDITLKTFIPLSE